jgi:hypothetical protein
VSVQGLGILSDSSAGNRSALVNLMGSDFMEAQSTKFSTGAGYPVHIFFENLVDGAAVIVHFTETLPSALGFGVV